MIMTAGTCENDVVDIENYTFDVEHVETNLGGADTTY